MNEQTKAHCRKVFEDLLEKFSSDDGLNQDLFDISIKSMHIVEDTEAHFDEFVVEIAVDAEGNPATEDYFRNKRIYVDNVETINENTQLFEGE